jgi:hypothetical protein
MENFMRTRIAVAAAGLIAVVAIGVWLSAASRRSSADSAVGKATLAPSIPPVSKDAATILDIYNRAHLENLPVEDFEDQSVVFTKKRQ